MNTCSMQLLFVLCAALMVWESTAADGKSLSIVTITEDPYFMENHGEFEGYCVDLTEELSKMLGFKYEMRLVPDGRYGALDSQGRWNGMMGEVLRGNADLAVAPLTLTATREMAVDMTTPFMLTGISFLMLKDSLVEESGFSLLAPFSSNMWAGLLIAFLLTGLCICAVGRISPCEWTEPDSEQQPFTLVHSFWYITGALTLQGAGPHPKALSGRVISAIWWLFAVLLLACYVANLSSKMNSDHQHMSIQTFEDLASQDAIEYGTVEGGSTMLFFKLSKNPVYERIYQNMVRKKSFVSSTQEGLRRVKEGNFAFIGESVTMDLAVARNCELVRAQEVISMRGYAIAAPPGSPWVKNLSIAILRMSESGVLVNLQKKWWASRCSHSQPARSSDSLQPRDLRCLFLLLSVGLGAGLLLSLLELAAKVRGRAKDSKSSCCSVLMSELHRRFGRGEESSEDTPAATKA
ncbi:putative glutamate receptor isoform 1-T1 [Synchiropus picturatus]